MHLSKEREIREMEKALNRTVSKLKHLKHDGLPQVHGHPTTGMIAAVAWNEASCRTNYMEQTVQPLV